jgi:hypothetical protein
MGDLAPPSTRNACLTDDEVAEVRAAAPAPVPEGLARHLAACSRCQERVLFGTEPRRRRRLRDASILPTPMRALILLAIMIAVMVVFFYTLNQLVGHPYP